MSTNYVTITIKNERFTYLLQNYLYVYLYFIIYMYRYYIIKKNVTSLMHYNIKNIFFIILFNILLV